jgi:hypothetical protein
MNMKLLIPAVTIMAACLLTGCKSATITGEREFAPVSAVRKPVMVYVADFELATENIKHQDGILPDPVRPAEHVRQLLSGEPKEREARARQLVDLMANSLVADLTKAGFRAVRISAEVPTQTDGWLIRGVVTEVQEGNRLSRTMIGFGQGATDLQVIAGIDDLSQGSPKPLYEIATDATSGKASGAAPTLLMNPYAAPVRFVMARQDIEKNVKQTATKIVEQFTKKFREAK